MTSLELSDSDLLSLEMGHKARNQLSDKDRAVHNWYRFVLSFPPHLVRYYLQRFQATEKTVVLDPFAGTGTTLVEVKKLGLSAVGVEANPMAHFACSTKLDWSPLPEQLCQTAETIAAATDDQLTLLPRLVPSLSPEASALLFKDAISPKPLQKVLTLLGHIDQVCQQSHDSHYRLALANSAVVASNLRFAPEVSVARKHKSDAQVVDHWLGQIHAMANDLISLKKLASAQPAVVHLGDARQPQLYLAPNSVDIVVTSPP